MKPNLIDLPSGSKFVDCKRTEILIRQSGKDDFQHHCDAVVLSEGSDGFLLMCALPCIESLSHTFHVRRYGFPDPVPIHQLVEGNHIRVQGKDFGYIYQGQYQ